MNETFTDNRFHWTTVATESLSAQILDGKYIIDFNSEKSWNSNLTLPLEIQNTFVHERAEITFNLDFNDRNGASTSGIGFIFDYENRDNYNLLYIGEESGKFFSAIIPKRQGNFKKPIKDGYASNLNENKSNKVAISKIVDKYNVTLNDKIILTFIHKENLALTRLYFTTGRYSLSDLRSSKTEISIDIGDDKKFDASSHKIYLLLAGISKYPGDEYKQLNSPLYDIKSMKEFWTSPSGGYIPESNIVVLPQEQATRTRILDNTIEIAKKATVNDVIIIYLTGHGTVNGYFCCFDNLLPYSELNQIISQSKAKNRLVIVDACFSGYAKNIITPPGKDLINESDLQTMFYYGVSMAAKNTAYLLSCQANETSLDGPNTTSNSAFTKALLQILRTTGRRGDLLTLKNIHEQLKTYFNQWNEEHRGLFTEIKSNVNGQLVRDKIPILMNPQLVSSDANNNLPLVIIH